MQEGGKIEFVEDLWVQCDAPSCRKWRRLPAGTVVDDHLRWYCRMNPDTRYNACDIEEEHYDERNEILLTAAKSETKPKGRNRSKKRKVDPKKELGDRGISPKAELQKRQQWCEKKLKGILESLERVPWTHEDQHYLHVHAPDRAQYVLECLNLSSAIAYFAQVVPTIPCHDAASSGDGAQAGDEQRKSMLDEVHEVHKGHLKRALECALADIQEMLKEASAKS